jgi:putative transposase
MIARYAWLHKEELVLSTPKEQDIQELGRFLSFREVAWHITDNYNDYISESSVYRFLKENGLISSPSFRIMSASDSFHDKTTAVNQMWQTDFTYFKIFGWGWYYLSTILDDYSRYIVHWELCSNMKADDVTRTIDEAIAFSGVNKKSMLDCCQTMGLVTSHKS